MSSQASSACGAQVLINFPPTTGSQALCLSPPHLRHGKSGVHALPTNCLLVQTKSRCWNRRAEAAGAWKAGRPLESVAVAYGGDGHIMMPGGLSIVSRPTAALRPRPMSNSSLGGRDQRHGHRLLESACTNSYGTHPPSTPQDVEDKDPNCSDIHDTSSDNIISRSKTTGLKSGDITLAGHKISTLDSTHNGSIPRGLPGFAPSFLRASIIDSDDGTPPPDPPR